MFGDKAFSRKYSWLSRLEVRQDFFAPNSLLERSLVDVSSDDPVLQYLYEFKIVDVNDGWILKRSPLDFYQHYDLYQLRKGKKSSAFLFAKNETDVRKGSRFLPLNAESSSIHEANRVGGLSLDGDLACDYARFFGEFVYGTRDDGERSPFLFIDRFESIPWFERMEQVERERLMGAVFTRFEQEADGRLVGADFEESVLLNRRIKHFSFPTLYQGYLFASHVKVYPSGWIEMEADQPLFKFSTLLPSGDP